MIVPVYNVQDFLAQALDSVLAQTLQSWEIVILDDGSTDSSPEIAAEYAAKDKRIRVYRQVNAGLGAARNAGIKHARGRWLFFLDSDDTIPADALWRMTNSLRASGSDFCVGAVARLRKGRILERWYSHSAATTPVSRMRIDDYPVAIQYVLACNRLVQRKFWKRQGMKFPEGTAYEDIVPMVQLYLSGTFDIVPETVYHWRIRDDKSSISQSGANLADRLTVVRQALNEIEASSASIEVKRQWLARVFNIELYGIAKRLAETNAEFWPQLVVAGQEFAADMDDASWALVLPDRRVIGWLITQDRREQLVEFCQTMANKRGYLPTSVDDGVVSFDNPSMVQPELPAALRTIDAELTGMTAGLEMVTWTPEGQCRLTGWAWLNHIDPQRYPVTVNARLRPIDSEQQSVPLPVVMIDSTEAQWRALNPFVNAVSAGFVLTVDPSLVDQVGRWLVELDIHCAGFSHIGGLTEFPRGVSGRSPAVRVTDNRCTSLRAVPGKPLLIQTRAIDFATSDLQLSGLKLTGSVDSLSATSAVAVRRRGQGKMAIFDLDEHGRFEVAFPPVAHPETQWMLELGDGNRWLPLPWPAGGVEEDSDALLAMTSHDAGVHVLPRRGLTYLRELRIVDESIVVELQPVAGAEVASVICRRGSAEWRPDVTQEQDRWIVRWPLWQMDADESSLSARRPISLLVTTTGGMQRHVLLDPQTSDRIGHVIEVAGGRVVMTRARRDHLRLRVVPTDER